MCSRRATAWPSVRIHSPSIHAVHDAPPHLPRPIKSHHTLLLFCCTEGTPFRFRLNWGAGGKRVEATPEFSVFVGDLAPEVTDTLLQETFAEKFPSTLGAKVGVRVCGWLEGDLLRGVGLGC